MTREEFMLQRLKDDAAMNRRSFPILVACEVIFVLFCIFSFATGRGSLGIGSVIIMVAIALRLPMMKQQIDGSERAISELEAHIADPSQPLSASTRAAIATSDQPASELFKGWIALAICAGMLIVMGAAFLIFLSYEGTMLVVLGIGAIIGGIVVLIPTVRMYRSWKTAKGLEEKGL